MLSQSRGEISLSAFAKKIWFESEPKENVRSKKNALIQRLLINTSFMTWSPCCVRMKSKSNFGMKFH